LTKAAAALLTLLPNPPKGGKKGERKALSLCPKPLKGISDAFAGEAKKPKGKRIAAVRLTLA
jgi:hypothetical protein